MKIRLRDFGGTFEVDYFWPDGEAPHEGDKMYADGSDPEVPRGHYLVRHRDHDFGLRGLNHVLIIVKRQ